MKKGFTLIELLAVIIILAVIALIATPVVLNVVDNAKKNANKNSAYGLIDAAKLYYAETILDNDQSKINGETNLIKEIKVSGDRPDNGEVYINVQGEIAIAVIYDGVCYKKEFEESKLTESEEENCKVILSTPQVIAYYAFGLPTTESSIDYKNVIIESGSNAFVKLEGEQLSVCIYRNNTLECFKNNNYIEENIHVQNVFGSDNCNSDSSGVYCDDDLYCRATSNGIVGCHDHDSGHGCSVSADGEVYWY